MANHEAEVHYGSRYVLPILTIINDNSGFVVLTSRHSAQPTAVNQVFSTVELLEMILLNLNRLDTWRAACVSQTFYAVVSDSPSILKALALDQPLEPDSEATQARTAPGTRHRNRHRSELLWHPILSELGFQAGHARSWNISGSVDATLTFTIRGTRKQAKQLCDLMLATKQVDRSLGKEKSVFSKAWNKNPALVLKPCTGKYIRFDHRLLTPATSEGEWFGGHCIARGLAYEDLENDRTINVAMVLDQLCSCGWLGEDGEGKLLTAASIDDADCALDMNLVYERSSEELLVDRRVRRRCGVA